MAEKSELAESKIKIRFLLDSANEQGIKTEDMWAEPLGDSTFRLLNSPFYAFGVSAEDVVFAEMSDNIWFFRKITVRGGHSTYRIYLQNGKTIDSPEFAYHWQSIALLGATFENANNKLIAVDIPPGANVAEIYHMFEMVEETGLWAFEEVHYEDLIASSSNVH